MLCVLAYVLACSEPLVVESLEPAEVEPGQATTLNGTGFPEDPVVSIERDGAELAVEVLATPGSRQLEVRVPPTATRGAWSVRVVDEEQTAILGDGLTIVLPRTDLPCAGTHRSHARVSLVRRDLTIEHVHRNGERDQHALRFDEVAALEVERSPLVGGEHCSAIWVRTGDERRLLLADDDAVDLEARARLLAEQLGRPVRLATP